MLKCLSQVAHKIINIHVASSEKKNEIHLACLSFTNKFSPLLPSQLDLLTLHGCIARINTK